MSRRSMLAPAAVVRTCLAGFRFLSENEDVLLLATWNQFVLINAQGDELLKQSMGHADQLDVTRDPADGRLLFYLTGSVNACYELIMPEPEPMIEFAGE